MQSFFYENPKWQTQTLSLLLNIMTIKMAELESQRSSNNYNDQVSLLQASSVFGHAICLSLLIKNMDFNLHGIP